MSSSYVKNAVVLGLLSAVGPFAIDMYLPALPAISADLKASTAATQMTLMAFFVTLGLCQIFYGPVSDTMGRKPPLYFGLGLFIIGSIGCAMASNIQWLIALRVVQGIGAASVMVIPRAIIRDLHTGIEATRLMALVMLVFSVSPILAPLVGSGLIVPFGWRSVFAAVTVASVISFLLVAFVLHETRPPEERVEVSVRSVLDGFAELFRDWRFLGLTFIGGFAMAGFFAFLASSSFIYMGHFGLTPTQYGLTFSLNAIGFIGASQFSAYLASRFGITRVVSVAVTCFTVATLALFAVTAAGVASLVVLVVMLFIANAWLGLVIPSTMVLSLEDHGPIAGMASALGGTLQMITGAVTIVVASAFFNGTALPMVTTIAVCAVAAFILTRLTLGPRKTVSQLAE